MLRHLLAATLAAFSFAAVAPLTADQPLLQLQFPCAAALPLAQGLEAEGYKLAERRTEIRGFAVEDWRGPAGWLVVVLLRDSAGAEYRCLAFRQGGTPA